MPERNDRDTPSSKQPPPPCDPFTRYQTPWPRNEKDEQNPFIQFRRFADEQFQSLFSGIPRLFGTSSSNADSFQHEVQDMMQRRREFEEGLRKQSEQDFEEKRQALEKLRGWADQQSQGQVISVSEPPESPWWQHGRAAYCPALNEERSERAKGCPAMFTADGQPKTELEAYEAYRPHTMRSREGNLKGLPEDLIKAIEEAQEKEERTPGPPAGWLTGLGWDGKRRHEKSTISVSRFSSRWLDPFNNSHDTIPWLLVNHYSPVALSNPDQPRAGQVKLQQGVNQPFRILGVYFLPRSFLQFNDRKDEMAKKLPWADAFEDLVSLQQTGKMVERDHSTYRTPPTWIHDMVHRGSLGPTWGFNDDGQLTKLLRDTDRQENTVDTRSFAQTFTPEEITAAAVTATTLAAAWYDSVASQAQRSEAEAAPTASATPNVDDTMRHDEKQLKELEQHGKESVAQAQQRIEKANFEFLSQLGKDRMAQSQHRLEIPDREFLSQQAPDQSSVSSTIWSGTQSEGQISDSVVSTTTTTERWTNADGRSERRRIFKRRFADGREVVEETHDLQEPKTSVQTTATTLEQAPWPVGPREAPSHDQMAETNRTDKQTQTATPVQDEIKKENRRGGWFWNN